MKISAATRLAGVAGAPVAHSLSPLLHNAAYRALGLDWAYLAFEVSPADFPAAVKGAEALGLVGLSVTMPHKEAAAAAATRRSPTARRLGAANTLTFENGEIVADSTDGKGFLADLDEALGVDPTGMSCAVLGAGAAARAVVVALCEAGAREVLVVNRTPMHAFRAAALARGPGRVARQEEIEGAELIVQATPIGMTGVETDRAVPVDPRFLRAGQLCVDLVYDPPETAFLAAAARAGARTRNGLGTLVQQAALQVARWTGETPPLKAMWSAARESLPQPPGGAPVSLSP